MTSADGLTTTFRTENPPTGGQQLAVTFPSGLQNTLAVAPDTSYTLTLPDGSSDAVRPGPDPRLGLRPRSRAAAGSRPAG